MREMVEVKKVLVVKVDTLKNITNALTKPLRTEKFSWCRETIGIARMDQ